MPPLALDPRLVHRLETDSPARDWVLTTLSSASAQPERATGSLRQASREARKLRSRERRALWDVVYSLIRSRSALGGPDAVPDTDWSTLLDRWLPLDDSPWTDLERSPAERLGVPSPVAAQILDRFDPVEPWLTASNARAPTFLRVHARRDRPALMRELARAGIETTPVGRHGLAVAGRANLQGHAAFRRGAFEIQDLGSQQVAEATLADLEAPTVLDLCAGAGGKSLALAALGARVTATDVRSRPLDELQKRAQRAGDRIRTQVVDADPRTLDLGKHDVVLVDVPCSGTGVSTTKTSPGRRSSVRG